MMEAKNLMKKRMMELVLPMAFQQFMLALVGASDAIMLGRLSQDAMSAVSLATQVTFLFNLFVAAFVVGENMFVAQYYGKGDFIGIAKVLYLVRRISCVTALTFWMGTLVFADRIMGFFTNEPALAAMGGEYLRMVGVSWFLSAVAQVYMTIMKNCGAVKLSTVLSSSTVILNIVLNGVLIFGLFPIPGMGVRGAALATVAATAVQAVWSAAYVVIKMKKLQGVPRHMRRGPVNGFRKRTVPVLLNELIWGGGFTMYSVIMGHMGGDAVAANGIANISKNLVVCLCLGLGNAGSIIVGNALGAGRFEEAREAGKMLTRASIVCGIVSGLFLLAVSPLITELVGLTQTAGEYLRGMFFICSYYLVGKSINCMTIGGIFAAGGDSGFGVVCDAITLWCIVIPAGYLCGFVFHLPVVVVYFVLSLDEILKLPVVYRHYKKYGWLNNITEAG